MGTTELLVKTEIQILKSLVKEGLSPSGLRKLPDGNVE